ncbi:MAG: signal peptidase I [Gammaproteobacteria bacterium]|nr:signal peptidase I [Gammaproteobacteria bacterium]
MSLGIHMDLELILVIGTLVTGAVWLLDKFFLRKRRTGVSQQRVRKGEPGEETKPDAKAAKEPWHIETCKSFFPILLIVLILRAFVAEPFRIPSGSMMPTLLHGDFILVSKFTYGIRLPVLHAKIMDTGVPRRGDVAVFRFPVNPADDYIKRIIGLPGDRIEYRNKTVFVNDRPMQQASNGVYRGTGSNSVMNGIPVFSEDLEEIRHDVMITYPRYNIPIVEVVPENHYFVMGDNRDHSSDSRSWGFVPEENLVGRAFLVWMNWDFAGKKFDFGRIGKKII